MKLVAILHHVGVVELPLLVFSQWVIKFVTGMESSFKPEHSCGVPFLISGVFGSQIEDDLLGQKTCFKNFGIKGETLDQIKILLNVGTYVNSSLSESEVLSFSFFSAATKKFEAT
jgi:hypothetical protein